MFNKKLNVFVQMADANETYCTFYTYISVPVYSIGKVYTGMSSSTLFLLFC